jgi:hypothetical protein
MTRLGAMSLALIVAGASFQGDDAARAAAVKKLANEVGDSSLKGDYARVIDLTHDGLVKELGGRDKAIEAIKTALERLKAQGITFKSYKVGDPGEFMSEGNNTFVIVPTVLELTFTQGRAISKSYLLGISSDDGKTWKFADGAGLAKKESRDRTLPKLPAKLKLPAIEQPEIIKDK